MEHNKLIAEFMDVKIGVDSYSYRPGQSDLLKEENLNYFKIKEISSLSFQRIYSKSGFLFFHVSIWFVGAGFGPIHNWWIILGII